MGVSVNTGESVEGPSLSVITMVCICILCSVRGGLVIIPTRDNNSN